MRLILNLASLFLFLSHVVSQQVFLSFEPQPAPLIEWDQQNYTYYTGQTLTMNWTSQNFLSTDLARIQYVGSGGTRTLTTGTSILAGTFSQRLSDASAGTASNVPLTIAHSTNTANSLSSTNKITVIQSKLMNIVPLDGNRTLGGGQNTVCDDRNLTVTWRGLGEAQFGVATVSLSKVSGSAGTLGTTQTNVPIKGNNTVSIFCPRTSVPSTFSAYAFQISVQEPGGSAYTGTSASFTVVVAPTPSPTSSTTPTSSKTPSVTPSSTPSPSFSNTPTPSVSVSNTPTPSNTPSNTPTPSPTPTANPSIDYAGLARAAAESVDTQTPAIAGAMGGIGGILVLLGAWKWYENKVMTARRKKKLAQSAKFMREAHNLYGVSSGVDDIDTVPQQPSIVMYSVQGLPPKKQTTQETKQMESYKKAFPPKQTNSK